MLGRAPQCPTARGISDAPQRIAKLDAFERWREPTIVNFETILGSGPFNDYWSELDAVIALLEDSQKRANEIRGKILAARTHWEARPSVTSERCGDPE